MCGTSSGARITVDARGSHRLASRVDHSHLVTHDEPHLDDGQCCEHDQWQQEGKLDVA